MPLMIRAMQANGNSPLVGHTRNDTLGVREITQTSDGKEIGDVKSVDGVVQPGTGGMSVSPSNGSLPPHLIPKRLRAMYPDARRSNALPETFPWKMGEGAFADCPLTDELLLRIDPTDADHGFVEPRAPVSLEEFRAAIEKTCPEWVLLNW